MKREKVTLNCFWFSEIIIMSDSHSSCCSVWSPDVDVWTDTVVVQAMRLILIKIVAFNTLMTIHAVIKW